MFARTLILLLLCFITLGDSPQSHAALDLSEPKAERIRDSPGIRRFGRVTPFLYRGGQPSSDGFETLKKHGIRTVLTFRDNPDRADLLQKHGMKGVMIPLSELRKPPRRDLDRFLKIISDTTLYPIFMHCVHGRDRTGALTAYYRVTVQGWTPDQAIAEMRQYDYTRGDEPHFYDFVKSLQPGSNRHKVPPHLLVN